MVDLDERGNFGEGISRPIAKARTKLIAIRVHPEGQRPMLVTLRAETKRHAIRYAKNRWPNATIETP